LACSLFARNPITSAMQMINRYEDARPTALERNPIKGGPIKKPKYPMVETAAMAELLGMDALVPAMLNTNGTIQDTPKPQNMNPRMAGPMA